MEYSTIFLDGFYNILYYNGEMFKTAAKSQYPIELITRKNKLTDLFGHRNAYKLNSHYDGGVYDYYSLMIAKCNNQYGIISHNHIVIPFEYQEIVQITFKHYLCKKFQKEVLFSFEENMYSSKVSIEKALTTNNNYKIIIYFLLENSINENSDFYRFTKHYKQNTLSLIRSAWKGRYAYHSNIYAAAAEIVSYDNNFNIIESKYLID